MKKLYIYIALLLIGVGCSSAINTEESLKLYENALSNFETFNSYEATYQSKVVLTQNKEFLDENIIDYNYKEVKLENGDYTGFLSQNISFEGTNFVSNSWYYDNFAYYSGISEPSKIEMDFESFKTQYNFDGILKDVSDNEKIETSNDGKLITFHLPNNSTAIDSIVSEDMDFLIESLKLQYDDPNLSYEVSNFIYEVVIDDNNALKSTSSTYEITIFYNLGNNVKNEFNFHFTLNMDILSTNNVTIELPDNLDKFELLSLEE